MKTMRSFAVVKLMMVAALAICLNAGGASAQEMSGHFTLPFEARWGVATLPAGDYSFALDLDKSEAGGAIRLFQGTKAVALIAQQSSDTKMSGRSELTVVRKGSQNTVCELSLPQIGVALHYAPAKPKRGSAAAEREMARVAVPITVSGK
jgi:hypothetical protein